MKDLLVLCADKMMESAFGELLSRHEAFGTRPIDFQILVHPQRDPGCFHHAAAFLRPLRHDFRYALVVLDRQWESAPTQDSDELTRRAEAQLMGDWGTDARVLVIDPELEVWVWSDSPHVALALGWTHGSDLRGWLELQGLWPSGALKPPDPKAAAQAAARMARIPWSAAICAELARKVSVRRCGDRSFERLREILRDWFASAVS